MLKSKGLNPSLVAQFIATINELPRPVAPRRQKRGAAAEDAAENARAPTQKKPRRDAAEQEKVPKKKAAENKAVTNREAAQRGAEAKKTTAETEAEAQGNAAENVQAIEKKAEAQGNAAENVQAIEKKVDDLFGCVQALTRIVNTMTQPQPSGSPIPVPSPRGGTHGSLNPPALSTSEDPRGGSPPLSTSEDPRGGSRGGSSGWVPWRKNGTKRPRAKQNRLWRSVKLMCAHLVYPALKLYRDAWWYDTEDERWMEVTLFEVIPDNIIAAFCPSPQTWAQMQNEGISMNNVLFVCERSWSVPIPVPLDFAHENQIRFSLIEHFSVKRIEAWGPIEWEGCKFCPVRLIPSEQVRA